MKICFVSPFPPRHDGISEFNNDLITALTQITAIKPLRIAINQDDNFYTDYYSDFIYFQIRKNKKSDYRAAANLIENLDVDLVCIQLEFALYGGVDGSYLRELIVNTKKKIVIIVHGSPINSYSRRILTRKKFFTSIYPFIERFIVLNPQQKKTFKTWGLDKKTIVILHGAPDILLSYQKKKSRQALHIPHGRLLIFSFGLIHPKKGFEYLIQAFQSFHKEFSNSELVISGEGLISAKAKEYISSLQKLIESSNADNSIILNNRFLEREEIFSYLSASDIVVFPYIKRDLVASGPLSFATLANKFIITTPFPYAKILLNQASVYFVPYKNTFSIEHGFEFFLGEKNRVDHMVKSLSEVGTNIRWSNIAKEYLNVFQSIA